MMRIVTILIMMSIALSANAQSVYRLDTVKTFAVGKGQSTGQGPVFFPRNVTTGPSPSARRDVPSVDPREICSLGLGGSITLGCSNCVVVDGPGIDLTIFENAFFFGQGRLYAEPAIVELSRDGETWFTVPHDSVSLKGLAGVNPTLDPTLSNPDSAGGTGIDFAEYGIDSVRWVRLTDVTSWILQRPTSPFYDPTLSGFDLDVIVAWHVAPKAFRTNVDYDREQDVALVALNAAGRIMMYDSRGSMVNTLTYDPGFYSIDLSTLAPGCYFVVIDEGMDRRVMKVQR